VHLETGISYSFLSNSLFESNNRELFIISTFASVFVLNKKTKKNEENEKRKTIRVYVGEISICSYYFQ
jgi:hypothetical protein